MEFRDTALSQGVITKKEKKWFNCFVGKEGELRAKIRLKGDWTDHLEGEKWSFRIKMKDGHFLNRKQFSIQSPKTRNFLKEWLFHQILEEEEILTTQYEFTEVTINGVYKGIYACEEHFKKQLLEFQERREGPILKLDESAFWELQQVEKQTNTNIDFLYPFFENSEILPFGKKKTYADSNLRSLFYEARDKLYRYKEGTANISEVFDVNLWAKYYALCDLFKAYHGLNWHNQRYYFNPITRLIEPVVFDAFSEDEEFVLVTKPFLGDNRRSLATSYFGQLHFIFQAFNDAEFKQLYHQYLRDYLNQDWYERLKKYEQKWQYLEQRLQQDHADYEFKLDEFLKNKTVLSDSLTLYDVANSEKFVYCPYQKWWKEHPDDPFVSSTHVDTVLIKEMGLKVYTEAIRKDELELRVTNQHLKPVQITGYRRGKQGKVQLLPKSVELQGYDNAKPRESIRIVVPSGVTHLVYMCKEQSVTQKISRYAYPFHSNRKSESSRLKTNTGNHRFKKGLTEVREPLIFDRNSQVVFEPGSTLILTGNASLVFEGTVQFEGTEYEPVILSARGMNNYVLFLKTNKVVLQHVKFEGFKSEKSGVSGAISAYQTSILLENCSFEKILYEDALNLVNCDFEIKNCRFLNTLSDAVDIDFGTGTMEGLFISEVGNDGIDLSGAEVNIRDVSIAHIGDKGISIGEKAKVQIEQVTLTEANEGIVVKDQSSASIVNSKIVNTAIGIHLFVKKDYYNPPAAFISGNVFEQVQKPTLETAGQISAN